MLSSSVGGDDRRRDVRRDGRSARAAARTAAPRGRPRGGHPGAHGIVARRTSPTTQYRTSEIADVTRIAANTRSVRNAFWDSCIQIPSPSRAPTYSPNTAPITAYTTAIRSPVKNAGSAVGQRSFRNACPSRRPVRAQQVRRVARRRAEPVQQRDHDREERHDHHDQHLRQQPEPEPQQEQRRQRDDRDRLRGHEDRLDRAPDERRPVHRHGRRDARAPPRAGTRRRSR